MGFILPSCGANGEEFSVELDGLTESFSLHWRDLVNNIGKFINFSVIYWYINFMLKSIKFASRYEIHLRHKRKYKSKTSNTDFGNSYILFMFSNQHLPLCSG